MQYFENEMARILINNDDIFSREKYRAALAESQVVFFLVFQRFVLLKHVC